MLWKIYTIQFEKGNQVQLTIDNRDMIPAK